MRSWLFERNGNKIFADFIRKSSGIVHHLKSQEKVTRRDIPYLTSAIFKLEKTSEFLDFSLKFFTQAELKEIFISSVYLVNDDFNDEHESSLFISQLNKTLSSEEIKRSLLKTNSKNETFFMKTLEIDSLELNVAMLNLVGENLSNDEVFDLLNLQEIVYGKTASMTAAIYQDIFFIKKFIEFMVNTNPNQNKLHSILLKRDDENDTMLQYAEGYRYPDNYEELTHFYLGIEVPLQEIQKTYIERKKGRLASFAYYVKSGNSLNFEAIANFLGFIFENDTTQLVELLSRRNENGDTMFSIYKNQKIFNERLEPIRRLLSHFVSEKEFMKLEEKN
jgi:hypothetical protein